MWSGDLKASLRIAAEKLIHKTSSNGATTCTHIFHGTILPFFAYCVAAVCIPKQQQATNTITKKDILCLNSKTWDLKSFLLITIDSQHTFICFWVYQIFTCTFGHQCYSNSVFYINILYHDFLQENFLTQFFCVII